MRKNPETKLHVAKKPALTPERSGGLARAGFSRSEFSASAGALIVTFSVGRHVRNVRSPGAFEGGDAGSAAAISWIRGSPSAPTAA